MEKAPERVHYFQADASALGGRLFRPLELNIPSQAPSSLSPAGGYSAARTEGFRVEGVLSFKSAYTQVAGGVSDKEDHGWTTLVSSAIEGLNVLDVLTVDRVVAQISTDHPRGNGRYRPKVTFIGTRFENLRIGGSRIEVNLDFSLFSPKAPGKSPDSPWMRNERLVERAKKQCEAISEAKELVGSAKDRYQWDNSQAEKKDYLLCSLVDNMAGKFSGTAHGHVLDVPEFGRISLGELRVCGNAFHLTMIRIELGCFGQGVLAAASADANGSTAP